MGYEATLEEETAGPEELAEAELLAAPDELCECKGDEAEIEPDDALVGIDPEWDTEMDPELETDTTGSDELEPDARIDPELEDDTGRDDLDCDPESDPDCEAGIEPELERDTIGSVELAPEAGTESEPEADPGVEVLPHVKTFVVLS